MQQPELGKKILELRKANGLTQEDLVARCNINVRTCSTMVSLCIPWWFDLFHIGLLGSFYGLSVKHFSGNKSFTMEVHDA